MSIGETDVIELKKSIVSTEGVKGFITTDLTDVRVAKRKPADIYPINRKDLIRIKNYLDELKPASSFWKNACSVSIGVLASSIIFVISISPKEKRLLVFVIAWTMLIISLILSVIFGIVAMLKTDEIEISSSRIKKEIEMLEEDFYFSDENI